MLSARTSSDLTAVSDTMLSEGDFGATNILTEAARTEFMNVLRRMSMDVEMFLLHADVSDGLYYIGEWRCGQIHGRGSLYSHRARILTGEFVDGKYVSS